MATYQDANGRWRWRAWVDLPDGTRHRASGSAPRRENTERAAARAERREVTRLETNGRPEPEVTTKEDTSTEIPTVKEFAPRFLAEYAATHKPSERRNKERALAILYPYFGAVRMDAIEQGHIQRFIAAQRKTCAPKTVNNRLAVLSSLLKYAHECRLIPKPALRFESGDETRGRKVFALPEPDVERLIDACTDERYRVAILLACEAGLRAGEIRGLQWTDIRDGAITVRRALDNETDEVIKPKHNKERTVPLSPRLASALSALPRRGLWVVSRLDGDLLGYFGLHDAIAGTYDRAGVTRPRKLIHCLRHAYGTVCARRGVPIATLQELMGHESVETTRQYISVTEDDKRAAVALAFGDCQKPCQKPGQQRRRSKSSTEK